jgi:hypothetical protein
VGYLMALAAEDTRTFGSLLRALLPYRIAPPTDRTIRFRSAEELRAKLIAQGVPAWLLAEPELKTIDADAVRRESEEEQAAFRREAQERRMRDMDGRRTGGEN